MWSGEGVGMGKDYIIFVIIDGNVKFYKGFKGCIFILVFLVVEVVE